MLNFTLMALLEANGAKAKTKPEEEDPAATDEDPADTGTDTEENPTDNPEDNDDNNTDTPEEETQNDEDENPDEKQEDQDETNPEEEPGEGEDDFSLDPEEGTDDTGENPDGLPDPDDDGSGDDTGTEDGEVNVHTNILQLSKLDRLMAKRQCFSDYQNLRTSITSFKNMVDENEATIEPAIRDYVIDKLDFLYTTVTDYLTYKFSYINYEENLQNYLIFMKNLNDLIRYVQTKGAEGGPTSSGKKTVDSPDTKKKSKTKPKASKKKKEEPEEAEEVPEDSDEKSEKPEEEEESEETV